MSGSYSQTQTVPTSTSPSIAFGIASGNVVGDSKPDLVIANIAGVSGYITVLQNDGTGSFSATAQTYSVPSGYVPIAVAVVDLNHDGKPDVVTTDATANFQLDGPGKVSVFINTGNGFAPRVDYDTGNNPYSLTVADLNGDKYPDLIVAGKLGASVSVLLNDGTGVFAATSQGPITLGTNSFSTLGTGGYDASGEVVTGDFNNDGKMDVVVADYGDHKLFLLPGEGDGTFGGAIPIALQGANETPFSVAAGDLNGDGKLDLVTSVTGGVVEVLLNKTTTPSNPSFALQSPTYLPEQGSHAQSLILTDLDGDKKLDLVAVGEKKSHIYLAKGNGDGTFGPPTTFSTGGGSVPYTATVGNFDGKGPLDVAVVNENNATVLTFEAACFLPGTLIRTPDGEVPIEALRIGDLVTLASGGSAPLRWVARQTVVTRFADPLRTQPVRVRAGALGENVPARDLLLSPDHALFLDGVLVQAGALVNGTSIVREAQVPERFTYYNLELATHALIRAEGAAAETFVDNIGRGVFDNAAEHAALYPDAPWIEEMPVPRAKSARQVPSALRQSLAARAADFGVMPAAAAA